MDSRSTRNERSGRPEHTAGKIGFAPNEKEKKYSVKNPAKNAKNKFPLIWPVNFPDTLDMEIISYVGSQCSKRNSRRNTLHFTALFKNKSENSYARKKFSEKLHNNSIYGADIPGAKRALPSAKDILRFFSIPMDFIIGNALLFSLSLAAVTSLIFFGTVIPRNFGFPRPLHFPPALDTSEAIDLQKLNNLMAAFALSENPGYTSDGTIDGMEAVDLHHLFLQPVAFQTYKVKQGDTISGITKKFNLKNISTLIAVNDIDNVRQLAAGQKLKIPSTDGLFVTVQKGDNLAGIAAKYNVSTEQLLDINDLEDSILQVGKQLFIPGAKLDRESLQNAMGELFKMPLNARFRYTSMFGSRLDPITGAKSTHKGIDMACPTGTPILASCSGTVAFAGYSNLYGNYVVLKHANGYQTLYAHMSKILAKKGQWISQGTRIGLVGSTGYSTGPHLHFTLYKNGSPINPLSVINK